MPEAATLAPPAPAPSKPAPKPIAAPAPEAKPPPPIPADEKSPTDYAADIAADFAELDADGASENPRPRDSKGRLLPVEKVKPAETAPEVKSGEEPPKPEDKPKPGTMRALGEAHDQLQKMVKTELRPKLQAAESQVVKLQQELADARKSAPDTKPMQEKMTALEKQNQELLEEIRYVNYQKHPEFIKNYQEKYNEYWAKATGEITQLNIETESGQVRKATANDLLALANAPLDQLDDLAEKWFGRSSARVIRHVEKIRDLAEAQDKALTDARKTAGEREKQQVTERQQREGIVSTAYSAAQKEIVEKYPKWFGRDPEDAEGNAALDKATAYADSVFNGNGALTGEQKAKRLAVIRAKAIGFDRQVLRGKAQAVRIAELEAALAEFEKSEPGADDAGNPGRVTAPKDFMATVEDELHKMDRR